MYIIKPQVNTRWRVMRYSPKGADDIHHASRGDDKTYKKLFDEFSARNFQKNATERTLAGENRYAMDIENFDIQWYNEIELPTEELSRIQSEALTWDAKHRNSVRVRSLNEISYRYLIDDDGIVHVYSRKNQETFTNREEIIMLTQPQKNLIRLLKSLGLDKETTVAIVALCETDENRQRMIDEIIYRYDQKGEVTEQDVQKIGLMLTGNLKPEYRDRVSQ